MPAILPHRDESDQTSTSKAVVDGMSFDDQTGANAMSCCPSCYFFMSAKERYLLTLSNSPFILAARPSTSMSHVTNPPLTKAKKIKSKHLTTTQRQRKAKALEKGVELAEKLEEKKTKKEVAGRGRKKAKVIWE